MKRRLLSLLFVAVHGTKAVSISGDDTLTAVAAHRVMHLLVALATAVLAPAVIAGELVGRVVSVHDGDTLTVLVDRRQVKVRLTEIDAPEKKQPFGNRSKQSLADMCAGKPSQIDDRGKDRYGRTLGRVTCAGVDANAEQVRRGMAWVYEQYAPKESRLYELQAQAQREHRGLWADPRPLAPWQWRRSKVTN